MGERVVVASGDALEAVRRAAPPGVAVHGTDDHEAVRRASFALLGWADRASLALLHEAPDLEVVQVMSAGTDWLEDDLPAGVTLCNARGARDVPVAEWCVGALLGAASGLLHAAGPGRGHWEHAAPAELADWTVVVLGHGSIGRAVEARLRPFGTRVVGVARTARDGVRGIGELPGLLPSADALVVLAPLTDATRGLVGARELALLPDGAVVANAGRGAVVDTEALLPEVATGRLRAVLDVTDPEPLPPEHPLWHARGTLAVTPHHAGDSPQADRRALEHAVDQVVRWARGEPLQAVVVRTGT